MSLDLCYCKNNQLLIHPLPKKISSIFHLCCKRDWFLRFLARTCILVDDVIECVTSVVSVTSVPRVMVLNLLLDCTRCES